MTGTKPLLFSPIKVGAFALKHRVVLAPMTRLRGSLVESGDIKTYVASDLIAEHYAQRASDGGLLITEGTLIALEAGGMPGVPGIFSPEQIAGWKRTTDAVHLKGGKIVAQLWAHGRVADLAFSPIAYGPSAKAYIADPTKPAPVVTPMTVDDIDRFVGHFAQAARNAVDAGFDGVEIHGANGYLVDQFIQEASNERTDDYGGSLENRLRFPLRVLNAVSEAIGAERVGIRMSPFNLFQGMRDAEPLNTFVPYAKAIVAAQPKLAYIHAVEGRSNAMLGGEVKESDSLDPIREIVSAAGIAFISAGGYTPELAVETTEKHPNELIAIGRSFTSNPDLAARIENGWSLTEYDRSTFYVPGEKGYTDFTAYVAA